jgi:hypothetical protein
MTGPFCSAIAPSRGDVVGERCRRIVNDFHCVSALFQGIVDAFSSGSVHEAAVDQHNIPHILFLIHL